MNPSCCKNVYCDPGHCSYHYHRGKLLFECFSFSTIWWKLLVLDSAQSIGTGIFMPSLHIKSPFLKSSLRQNMPSILKVSYRMTWLRFFKFMTEWSPPSFSLTRKILLRYCWQNASSYIFGWVLNTPIS